MEQDLLNHDRNSSKIIGANLRALRIELGLSQKDVGTRLSVSFQQIQKYESGQNRLPVEHLFLLKHWYDIPFAAFFTGMHNNNAALPDIYVQYIDEYKTIETLKNIPKSPERKKIMRILNMLL